MLTGTSLFSWEFTGIPMYKTENKLEKPGYFCNFLKIIPTRVEEILSDRTKKKDRVRNAPKAASDRDFGVGKT